MRRELELRNISPKGLKSQLVARLMKALKAEQEKEQEDKEIEAEKAAVSQSIFQYFLNTVMLQQWFPNFFRQMSLASLVIFIEPPKNFFFFLFTQCF